MQRLDDGRLRDIEDVFGMVVHHPREVRISSSAIGFLESRRSAVGRLLSTRYLWWIAFLLCWLLFGRVLPVWSLVHDGFGGVGHVAKGIEAHVPLTLEQAALVARGEEVFDLDGRLVIDPEGADVHRLTVGPSGMMTLDGVAWVPGDVRGLCPGGRGWAVVVVWPAMSARYRDVVTALDGLVPEDGAPCRVRAALVGAPRPLPPETPELDHVMIAVRDLDAAARQYSEALGFRVVPGGTLPNGIRNAIVPFSNKTYLEPVTVADPERAAWLARFLERREGIPTFALRVDSADALVTRLRARGVGVDDPVAVAVPGGTKPMFRYVRLRGSPLPNDLFFVEYDEAVRQAMVAAMPPAARRGFTSQPNGARELHAVWVAVRDVDAAAEAYRRIGLPVLAREVVRPLRAFAMPVVAGHGEILLLRPWPGDGPVARFLERYGEGVIGISVEVWDVGSAQRRVAVGTGREPPSITGPYDDGVLVPSRDARGVAIELYETFRRSPERTLPIGSVSSESPDASDATGR